MSISMFYFLMLSTVYSLVYNYYISGWPIQSQEPIRVTFGGVILKRTQYQSKG